MTEVTQEPTPISAEEVHALLAGLREENNALRKESEDLRKEVEKQAAAAKAKEAEGTVGLHGGAPILHHLHLVDGRVINDYEGIGTHYSEMLEDGTEKVTRIREHYPVNEVAPTKAYA